MKRSALKVSLSMLFSILALNTYAEPVTIKTVGDAYKSTAPAEIPGNFNLPSSEKPIPAVLIVHGSAGPDSRGPFHSAALNAAGIATLEIDMWKPRSVTNLKTRPPTSLDTLPDVWGAYIFLKSNPKIDPNKIGIMGFSWGGVNTMTVVFDKKPKNAPASLDNAKFNAAVAFYPLCDAWVKGGRGSKLMDLSHPTDAPLLIQIGTKDDYELSPDMCDKIKADNPKLNLSVYTYEGDTHGFDMQSDKEVTAFDPTAKGGKGAQITMRADKQNGELARTRTVEFFKKSFGMN